MSETWLLVGEGVILLLLFSFVWAVARSSARGLGDLEPTLQHVDSGLAVATQRRRQHQAGIFPEPEAHPIGQFDLHEGRRGSLDDVGVQQAHSLDESELGRLTYQRGAPFENGNQRGLRPAAQGRCHPDDQRQGKSGAAQRVHKSPSHLGCD